MGHKFVSEEGLFNYLFLYKKYITWTKHGLTVLNRLDRQQFIFGYTYCTDKYA
jgi:hypothetical protein